jgi:glycerol-3-phosphate cytidylyltransferase-like family protein
MKNKNNANGFAILEIILLVVTLSFVVAIAYVVVHHSKQAKYQPVVKTSSGNFIEIPEWKVKLTVPEASQKISYKILDKDNPNEIVLSSEALDKFTADHKECGNANQFIYIDRVKVGQPLNGVPWDQAKPTLDQKGSKSLGLYYYFNGARPSVSPCIGSNIAQIQQLNNEAYDLYDKLPSYQNVVINL